MNQLRLCVLCRIWDRLNGILSPGKPRVPPLMLTSGVDEDNDDDVASRVAPWTTSNLLPALHSPNAYAVSIHPESPNSCECKSTHHALFTLPRWIPRVKDVR